ncbi:unnamed protein product [Medioppia subpectinata]|uniref:Geranylgeranyl diphosphate synthase n=1 Tax=Medioppia subpectinata TaxID=1979941 RepID=A0A7R9Q681_9ACAR|nr:unnamed protein product [Medioppia subpectinata]CAG2114572.1 unnamed protein product [Medioppia subpectinata]
MGVPHLLEPYNYLVRNSGKQIRTKMIKAFNVWLQLENKDLLLVSEIIELLHNSAILIDDIEDSSELRRGEPSAHLVYGIATTINCGNYGYFLALEKVVQQMPQHLQQKACEIYANQMIELHQGQDYINT